MRNANIIVLMNEMEKNDITGSTLKDIESSE